MNYELHPISIPELDMLKTWLSCKEANLFRDLVEAEMESEWLQAIQIQSQSTERPQDHSKFSNQAAQHLKAGDDIRLFMQLFSKFSSPDHPFKRIKHK